MTDQEKAEAVRALSKELDQVYTISCETFGPFLSLRYSGKQFVLRVESVEKQQ